MEKKPTGGSNLLTQSRQHRDLVSRIKSLWQRNQTPDAMQFLTEHSNIRENRALSLELAYEEYCIRRENGEEIQRSVFCQRFPSISRSLYRQIEVDEYLRQHPELISPQAGFKWPARGERLFGFLVVEEIGRGAFARAYLCAQPGIGNRHVVVKVAQGGAVEADTMGTLDHPNIMSVYSVQEDGSGLTGICMPFVGRSTLHDVIDMAFTNGRAPLTSGVILEASQELSSRVDRYHQLIPRMRLRRGSPYVTGALQIGLQVAEALAHAHERGVLHGDLKPSNIVMSMDGIPVIVDFNLSLSQGSHNLVTGGTLPYMAPEQIRSVLLGSDEQDRIDHRSDIFALGAILFELLTGRVPYPIAGQDDDPVVLAGWMLDAQSAGRPTWPAHIAAPPYAKELILSCLAYSPEDRPSDMVSIASELRRALTWRRRSARFLALNRSYTWSLIGVTTILAGGASAYYSLRPPERDRHFARGIDRYASGEYQEAMDAFGKTLAIDRDYGEAYLGRACSAIQMFGRDNFGGWLDIADRDLGEAVRLRGTNDSMKLWAYCDVKKGQAFVAEDTYRQLLLKPTGRDVETLSNLAYCLEKRIPSSFSIQSLEERRKSDEEMAQLLREAIQLESNYWQPHLSLALLDLNTHWKDRSYVPRDGYNSIKRVIELNPNHMYAYVLAAKYFAVFAQLDGQPNLLKDCIAHLKKAVELGHDPEAIFIEPSHPLSQIKDDPDFLAVLQMTRGKTPPTDIERLIKPKVLEEFASQLVAQ